MEKEVKVKIPIAYHVKLHSMKILTGKSIQVSVTEALAAYFAAPVESPAQNHVKFANVATLTAD